MTACAWCHGEIPAGKRRDAVTCSKRCRQARHRFTRGVGTAGVTPVDPGRARRIAYADPPYPGLSARYYGDHPDFDGEVDHAELVASLVASYDTWALSTSAAALQEVLAVCPPGVRVAAWVRGARENKGATGPLTSWEPVIYGGQLLTRRVHLVDSTDLSRVDERPVAENLLDGSDLQTRRVDSLVAGVAARTTDPKRVVGAKPAAFCGWLFRLLDARPGDVFVDVFPGSGGVARAWETYTSSGAAVRLDA